MIPKFRAWEIKGKAYINGFNMIGFSTGQGGPERKLQRYNIEWKMEDVILEQFIGRLDKDGKEIYEGDIAVHYDPTLDECYEDRMKYKTIVTMFNLQVMSPERRIRLEIIGTIHDKENHA